MPNMHPKESAYTLTAPDLMTLRNVRQIVDEALTELGHIPGWFRDLSAAYTDLNDLLERAGDHEN